MHVVYYSEYSVHIGVMFGCTLNIIHYVYIAKVGFIKAPRIL